MKLHSADLLVIAAYAILTLAIGLRFSKRNKTTERYFLGGRDFPGWAIGLSFIGSTISSITFIAYPADSFKTAWIRILPPLAFPLVVLIACYAFIPFFRRGTAHSAYHYLALRFGPSVSLYAALVYLVMQVVRAATITYLLAVMLSSMTNLPVLTCILFASGVTAVYTVKGGFEAVVWTDVIQTIVLLSGAIACVFFIVHALPGGLAQVFSEAWAADKLSLRDLNPVSRQLEPVVYGEDDDHARLSWRSQLPSGPARPRLGAALVLGQVLPRGAQGHVYPRLWCRADLGRVHVSWNLPVDLLPTFPD